MTDSIKDTTKDNMRMGAVSVHHSCQQTHREEIFCQEEEEENVTQTFDKKLKGGY